MKKTVQTPFILLLLILLTLTYSKKMYAQNPNTYPVVSLCDIDLNRTATKLSSGQLATVSPANKGFIWNTGDNETDAFRPQGVTDITLGCRKYIGVSWYGRSTENYENRGARVSLVDISDMDDIQYRHILLVDENYNTFNNIHAGGLLYKDDTLYIPDTRSGSTKRIYGFALSDIKEVPNSDLSNFYNYRYIVKRVITHHLPIQASTISYDWDSDEMLIATFKNLCNTCTFNPETTFSWFGINNVNGSSPFHANFFDKAQGMASIDNPLNPSRKLVWMATSYGRNNPSHIYAAEYDRSPNNTSGQTVNTSTLNYTAYQFPPGLENLHFEQDKSTLWTLTEFTPNEGTGNNRMVFAFNKNDLMPPGQNPDEYPVTDLCDLDLNRDAVSLDAAQLSEISPAQKGFMWNSGDNSTLKHRPKGITGIPLSCRDYIGVSWYGREDEEYGDRGSRVSFVDVSDMENIKYRHVLLVDENYKTFENIHVGGLMYKDDTLYIPDTRSGSSKKLYGFSLNDIKRVPNEGLDNFYNYRYIIKRVITHELPIQASSLSYDWDSDEMVIGTFKKHCTTGCDFNSNSTFAWSSIQDLSASAPYHTSFFDRIQGVASMDNPLNSNEKMIWTSTSYGRTNTSHLYATTYNRNPNNTSGQIVDTTALDFNTYLFPPGLNDLYLEENKDTLWTLTEFGSNQGTDNNRLVFTLAVADVMPPTSSVGLQNEQMNEIRIYPNPAKNSFYVDLGEQESAFVNVYNSVGTLILKQQINQKTSLIKGIETSGYYTIEIRFEDKVVRKKLLIN
ncbi:MAG TPA: T9SS type A sorting domain-containing protein [Brumimicrobium sp.]|nr:T9SS type A sorting domain-containing protein [Brumimicrobium sp.]